MKKTVYIGMMAVCLFMGTTSCNKDDGPEPVIKEDLSGKADVNGDGIEDMELTLSVERNTVGNESWQDKDAIGFFFVNRQGGAAGDTLNWNVRGLYNDITGWAFERRIVMDDEPMQVYAYYPYSGDTHLTKWELNTTEPRTYMYAKAESNISYNNKHVHVKMKRALAHVNIRIRTQVHLADFILDAVRLVGRKDKLPTGGVMNIKDEKVQVTQWGKYEKDYLNLALAANYIPSNEVTFQVMPMASVPTKRSTVDVWGVNLEMEINGMEYIVPLADDNVIWDPGSVTEINIIFNGVELIVENVNIRGWEEDRQPNIDIE